MSTKLEKAIEKVRTSEIARRTVLPKEEPRNPEASGVYKILAPTRVKPDTMERNKIMPALEDKAAITAYKVLRTRVLQRLRANNWRTFIVTATDSGEGKTLTASNLAMSIARDVNQSVFLVDLDLQRPSIAKYFGLDVKMGIGEYLKGEADIEDILYRPEGMERIVIVPSSGPVENASELIGSPRMKEFMRWLGERTTPPLAIFDMPPVLACDDVLAFLPSVDAVLFVVAEEGAERNRLARALDMLGEFNLLGAVLNKSKEHIKTSPYY
jgi:Mrp family chromosome partitioning ATPase